MDSTDPIETITTTTETITMPTSGVYVNVDFNDLLLTHSEEEAYQMIGKLKDLLQP